MTNDDRTQFAMTLAALAAAYREELDEAMAEGYWLTLSDLPLDRVKAAVLELMRTSKFMPRASEIRSIIVDELAKITKAEQRKTEIRQGYSEGVAFKIVRDGRRAGLSEEAIAEQLDYGPAKYGVALYWPGYEPWTKVHNAEIRIDGIGATEESSDG